MRKRLLILVSILCITSSSVFCQSVIEDSTYKKHFIGSSFFMLGNFSPINKPDFVQLNFGYRLNPKNVLSIELKTWKYAWSLGIPYGSSFEAPDEKYPGYIREFGIALAYQHFWKKGFYSAIHLMNARQTFYDENNMQIKNGYQLFTTYRLGYQFKCFNNKVFIEPSIAITHRPIQTNMPDSFAQLNDKWPNYFIGEPGLHFGFNF